MNLPGCFKYCADSCTGPIPCLLLVLCLPINIPVCGVFTSEIGETDSHPIDERCGSKIETLQPMNTGLVREGGGKNLLWAK